MDEKNKRALIIGADGQDGKFLTSLLNQENYRVLRTVKKLSRVKDSKTVDVLDVRDTEKFKALVEDFVPDEIYNLAGMSSVSSSFQNPELCFETNSLAVKNMLAVLKETSPSVKFYQSSSSEMFGDVSQPANEDTKFNPLSPYAESKVDAHLHCKRVRENEGIPVFSGILFNHESEFRPHGFVTRKITSGLVEIFKGKTDPIELGDISIVRDWGYASDHVAAMHKMVLQGEPDDYVVATGISHSLREFIKSGLKILNLPGDIDDYISINSNLFRESELRSSYANPNKINSILGWYPEYSFDQMIEKIVRFEIKSEISRSEVS
jgi:GDPmannose 4,6-dehydratase